MKAHMASPTTPDNAMEDSMNDHITDTDTNTSAEAMEATTAAAQAKPSKAKKTKPERPVQPEAPAVRILKVSTCPSLSGRSDLTYHVGCIDEAIQLRVYQNSGKGYFNQEWIAFSHIRDALNSQAEITAATLRPIIVGKSVNTAGFFLAVLRNLGLIEVSTQNRRCYRHTESEDFETEAAQLMASGVSIEVAEQAKTPSPTTQKGTLKLKTKKP